MQNHTHTQKYLSRNHHMTEIKYQKACQNPNNSRNSPWRKERWSMSLLNSPKLIMNPSGEFLLKSVPVCFRLKPALSIPPFSFAPLASSWFYVKSCMIVWYYFPRYFEFLMFFFLFSLSSYFLSVRLIELINMYFSFRLHLIS